MNEPTAAGRIAAAFDSGKAFIAFITGGDPDIATTERVILALVESGVALIEIGVPFSDPVAEGPVIQAASARALAGGVTVDDLFAMVARLRPQISVPLVFMTYLNPILVYGKDRFISQCAAVGVDGVIVPDLPFEERAELTAVCAAHDVCQIAMIAPTSHERIQAIAAQAEGFLYCVSSLGVTGVRSQITGDVGAMVKEVKQVSAVPCAIGFGIATGDQAQQMAAIADGVIIGSAIVKLIAEHRQDAPAAVAAYAKTISDALQGPI